MTAEEELRLLRRYEPIVRYNRGELFLPCAIDGYLAHAALYRRVGKSAEQLAAPGALDTDKLAAFGRAHHGESLYLQFVDQPLGPRAYRKWRKRPDREKFTPSSRFAAVGLLARLIDSVLRMTLLLRGKVPRGYAAAAHVKANSARDRRAVSLLRARQPRRRLRRPPVLVLLPDERLALDVRRRQRPRSRLGAGDDLPRRACDADP